MQINGYLVTAALISTGELQRERRAVTLLITATQALGWRGSAYVDNECSEDYFMYGSFKNPTAPGCWNKWDQYGIGGLIAEEDCRIELFDGLKCNGSTSKHNDVLLTLALLASPGTDQLSDIINSTEPNVGGCWAPQNGGTFESFRVSPWDEQAS